MKRFVLVWMGVMALVMFMAVFARPIIPPAQATDPNWENLAPGIDYREYHLPDPNNVFVARMVISNTNVTLESAIASGYLASGMETVRNMASRYDQTLSQWGHNADWGAARNDVVVTINGDYFTPNNGMPLSGMVQAGWYIKRYNDYGGRTGFGWKFSRTPFIGECVAHLADKQFIQFADGSTLPFNGINIERDSDQIVLYTPHYDTNTRTEGNGLEVLVTLSQPAIIYPSPRAFTGTIQAISDQSSTSMQFDQIVLSATGSAADDLNAHVHEGEVISISQEIASRQEFDCDAPLSSVDWSKTYASIGGDYYFLKEGQIKSYDCSSGYCNREPRTAIAYNNQYIYFIVVDGRDLIDSIGMTVQELSIFARDTLSATHGVTQDGGGSSTMVVNGVVVNNTFCNNIVVRGCTDKIYMPLTIQNTAPSEIIKSNPYPPPTGERRQSQIPAGPLASTGISERGVANGMMMVVIEPEQRSTQDWMNGQVVILNTTANLRQGPGTHYAATALVQPGVSGIIQPHPLNGVLAKGYFWWKVSLNTGYEGWLVEDALTTP